MSIPANNPYALRKKRDVPQLDKHTHFLPTHMNIPAKCSFHQRSTVEASNTSRKSY
jgi:hypothetical protein